MSRRVRRAGGTGRGKKVAGLLGWLLLMLSSLSAVTWRQPRGVEMERALREIESERQVAQGERVASERRIEELRSRERITRVATDRLGMHIPADEEIVLLLADQATLASAGR